MKSGAEQHKQFSVQCTHFLQQLKAVMKSQVRSFLPYFLLLAAASAWCLMRSSRHAAAPPSDKSQTVPLSPAAKTPSAPESPVAIEPESPVAGTAFLPANVVAVRRTPNGSLKLAAEEKSD